MANQLTHSGRSGQPSQRAPLARRRQRRWHAAARAVVAHLPGAVVAGVPAPPAAPAWRVAVLERGSRGTPCMSRGPGASDPCIGSTTRPRIQVRPTQAGSSSRGGRTPHLVDCPRRLHSCLKLTIDIFKVYFGVENWSRRARISQCYNDDHVQVHSPQSTRHQRLFAV